MKILITGVASLLGRTLVEQLTDSHHLRLVDSETFETSAEFILGDIRDQQVSYHLCDGMDAVIHLCELPDTDSARIELEQEAIDLATRGTYNLFKAASAAEVQNVIFISSMKLMLKYPEDFQVTENWKPRPDPNDAYQMAKYLGETTALQFARFAGMEVTCLRVGNVVIEEECIGQDFDPLWIDARDVAKVVKECLEHSQKWKGNYRWRIRHLVACNPRSRFYICVADDTQEFFVPDYNFMDWKETE